MLKMRKLRMRDYQLDYAALRTGVHLPSGLMILATRVFNGKGDGSGRLDFDVRGIRWHVRASFPVGRRAR